MAGDGCYYFKNLWKFKFVIQVPQYPDMNDQKSQAFAQNQDFVL